jgi:Flp pilus assembly protein TadG
MARLQHWRDRHWRGRHWRDRHWRDPQRGSMSVELAVIAPALVLLLLLVGAAGRVVEAQGHLDGAARDAARAASLAGSPAQAAELAQQAAQGDLGASSWCAGGSVRAPVIGFPSAGQLVGPGSDVRVTVTCDVSMSPFRLLGFGATMHFSGTGIAPLDPFTCRGPQC